MRLIHIVSFCLLFIQNVYANPAPLDTDLSTLAAKEGWTFKFNPNPPNYPTGLTNYSTGLLKRGLRATLDWDNLSKLHAVNPRKLDWREKGIGPIRNQGNCGSCWSFSLVAALRDALILFGKDPGPLSEQMMVDCAVGMYGCNGGLPEAAREAVSPKGVPLLSDYPYIGRNGKCYRDTVKIAASAESWHFVGSSNRSPTVEEIKTALNTYGPLSTTVAADRRFMAYQSGIYNGCTNSQINHMTDIVGYDDDGQYWIMRNSWGTSWGEQGYMRIRYTDSSNRLCNNLGDETVYFKVDAGPIPPPTPREVVITGQKIKIRIQLPATSKTALEEAKRVGQYYVDAYDRKAP